MQFDGIGMLWLRTATQLARVDTRGRKLIVADEVVGEANEEEGKPSVDAEGKLLVPSSSGLYWQQNGQWRLVNVKHGLASNLIQCALEDREGTLWVGGSGTGLDRLTGVREWSAWTTAEGLPDNSTWTTLRDRRGESGRRYCPPATQTSHKRSGELALRRATTCFIRPVVRLGGNPCTTSGGTSKLRPTTSSW